MVTMLKDLIGPWERVRQGLISDLEHLEAAINTRFAAVFSSTGQVTVPAGGTGLTTLPAHSVLVGADTNPIVGVSGSGVLHLAVGVDPVASPVVEADLSFSDLTTQNVTSTKHGLAPKAPADATMYLNGAATPAYVHVRDSDLALTDITTNNVTSTAHGFVPKLPNDGSKFLDGTGLFSTAGGMPIVGAVQTTGKRVCWIQKSGNANVSSMLAVGCDTPSVTGGTGIRDNVGFWATPQTVAGGTAGVFMTQPFVRLDQLPKIIIRLRTPSTLTQMRFLMDINESASLVNTDTPATASQRGVYVRYSTAVPDGGWVVQTVDSLGRSVSATILPIVASTVYLITIAVVSTSSVNVTINGTVVNVTTHLPAGVDLRGEFFVADLSGSSSKQFDLESIYIES